MREIKFRAWDGKKMHKVCRLGIDGFSTDLWSPSPVACESRQDGALQIMQFTGLHDKNGKEIFEGDILSVNWSIKGDFQCSEWRTEKHVAVILWDSYQWIIGWSYFSKPLDVDGNKEICWYDDYHRANQPGAFHKLTDLEVLGNIYENPDLLKERVGE